MRWTQVNLLLLSLVALLFACDKLYDPVIVNRLHSRVDIRIEWADGTTSEGHIPAGGVVHVGHPKNPPTLVTVTQEGRTLAEVSESDFPSLLGRPAEGRLIGWALTPEGVEPITENQRP